MSFFVKDKETEKRIDSTLQGKFSVTEISNIQSSCSPDTWIDQKLGKLHLEQFKNGKNDPPFYLCHGQMTK